MYKEKLTTLNKDNIGDIIALTPMQGGMLFHYLEDTGSDYYFEQLSLDISGEIDRDIFEKAWNFVIETNEMLRTVFRWESVENPVQIILKEHKIQPGYYDFSGKESDEKQKRLDEVVLNDRGKKFDLKEVPSRINLCKLEKGKYRVIVSNHHILYDGWSNGIILKEFFKAYDHLSRGNDLVKPVKTGFKEFIQWLKNQDTEKQEQYWRSHLEGFAACTGIPVKRKKTVQVNSNKSYRWKWGREKAKELTVFLKKHKLTFASLLYSAWGILLQKYNNSDDVVFGTTVSGRSAKLAGIEEMVGLFINTLPLRIRSIPHEKAGDLLKRIETECQDRQGYEHSSLVNIKKWSEIGKGEELFDSLVVLENYPLEKQLLTVNKGLSIDTFNMFEMTHYDLTVSISIFDEIELQVIYNRDLFADESIERLIHHFDGIVEALTEHPGGLTAEIEITAREEKNKILYNFNDTQVEYPAHKTIHRLFAEQVERTPDSIALVGPHREKYRTYTTYTTYISYRELNDRVDRLANKLIEQGVRADALVGIMVERSVEMIVGILGILKAGGAYLPIAPDYPQERIDYMLQDSKAKILLTRQKIASTSSPQAYNKRPKGTPSHPHLSPAPVTSLAYIIYTSGSTGKPKGVIIEHGAVVNLLFALQQRYPLREQDTYLLKTSYLFDVSVTELFGWFPEGGRLAVLEPGGEKDPKAILEMIVRERVTHINFVPSMFHMFVEILDQVEIVKLASMKYIFLAGEALLPGPVNRFRRLNTTIAIENIYGPTEAAVYASWYSLADWRSETAIPIGKPLPNITLYIVDKWGYLQPIEVPGELCIGGLGLARGYLNNPELTTDRFLSIFNRSYRSYRTYIPGRLYATGDLARWLPGGNIEFLGRMDYQVKVRGFRIELGEIENCLLKHPAVKEAVVVAHKDTGGEVRLCAYVVGSAVQDELSGYLSGVMPGYMVPAYFEIIEAIPLTSSGKINRRALPAPAIKSRKKYTAPRNEIEAALVDTWAEVLKPDKNKIGIDDNFFELGGHSLNATALVSKIHKKLKFQFQLQQVFEISTIRAQAAHIAKQAENPYVYIEAGEEKEYYDLSYAQRRLWVLCQFEEDSAAYNMPRAQAISGDFASSAFIKAAQALADRHESLRTIFIQVDGSPRQKIVKDFTFNLVTINLRELEPGEKEKKAREIFIEDANRAFDLRSGPLFRFTLVRLADKEYVLIFNIHHIINDGWSQGTIHNEIIRLYNAFLGKDRSQNLLPALLLRYRDYARWHNRCIETGRFDAPGQYWLEKFKDKPNGIELPQDYPRRPVQTFNGGRVTRGLGTEKTRQLHRLCLEQDATLFMCLLTLLDIFLYKYSAQTGIIIGAPIAGRRYAELHPLVGFLVNTLVYRCQVNPDHSFKQLLAVVKEETLACYRNQDYPFDRLVEELELDRDLSQSPLFNVMLAHNNAETRDISLTMKDAHMSRYVHADDYNMSKFDLIFFMDEIEDQVWLQLEYNSDLFARPTIERMAENFLVLIDNVTGDIHAPVSSLNCLSQSEYRRVIHEFNSTSHPFPPLSIQELLEKQVAESKDKTALVYKEDHISYEVLNRQTNRYAHYLKQDQGIIRNRVVGIAMDRSIRMIYVLLGIIKSGGAYLAVDPAYPRERVLHVLADSQAGLLVTDMIRPGFFEDYPGQIIEIDRQEEEITGKSPVNPPLVNQAEDILYVNYTSGSTGMPNGAMLSHGLLANLIHWQREKSSVDCALRCLQFTTINFCVSFQEILGTLTSGGQLYLIGEVERQDIDYLMNFLSRNQIENLFLPFSYLNFLFTETSRWHESFKHNLKHIITAGEQLKVTPGLKAFLDQSPWIKLHNHYGSSEMHVVTSYTLDAASAAQTPIPPAGKPVSNTRIYILDEYFNPVPVGVWGEIFAAGAREFAGYINNSSLTGKKLIAHSHLPPGDVEQKIRLYRTGDLGRWLANGNIEYKGRKDLMVKIRGFRVELGEIETQLLGHGKVKEAAVIVRDETGKDKYLCAYIVGTQEAGIIDPLELREYLAGRLPDYMLPSYFVQLDRIPLTPNGKVDKESLPAPTVQEEKDYVAPRDNTEKKLVDIWSEILGIAREKISINDNFFHLGGHSLKATVLVTRISKELGVKIPLTEVFINPYIRRLAAFVKEAGVRRFFSIEAVEKKEYYLLSSAQRRLLVLQHMDENGIAYNMPGVWQLEGELDKEKFASVFRQLIRRHESLRTSFHMVNDEPVQRINGESVIGHWSLVIEEAGENGIAGIIKNFIKPFDLSRSPLLRAELIKLPHTPSGLPVYPRQGTYDSQAAKGDRYILMLDMHHIISDGISIGIFANEFMELYAGNELPALRLQYKDYSAWQKRQSLEKSIKQQEAYWLKEFSGDIPVLELPLDYPRPVVQDFAGSSVHFEIGRKETEALKSLANEQEVTLFMLILSLYTACLSRICGQEDIVVGTPIANRRHADLQPLMGMFVNTLALRGFPSGTKSFNQFLQEVKESTVKAFENQDYLYEDLVEQVAPRRDTGRNPLFDTMFTLENFDVIKIEIPGLTAQPFLYETRMSKFDLVLSVVEGEKNLFFTFGYCTKLFKQETIDRFIGYFVKTISAATHNHDTRLSAIEFIDEAEKNRLLYDFNDTAADYPKDKTIHRLFEEQAERTPDNTALAGPAGIESRSYKTHMTYITYRQLNEKSNRLARLLIEKGFQADTIVGIMVERSVEMIMGIMAILKSGGAYLPIDPGYPRERIDYMLKDSGAKILLTGQEIADLNSPQALYLSEGHHPGFPVSRLPGFSASLPSSLAYVIYTSGTTGKPKGVSVNHSSVVNLVYSQLNLFNITVNDRVLQFSTICFDASVEQLFITLFKGAALVLIDKETILDSRKFDIFIFMHGITHIHAVPSFLNRMELNEQSIFSLKRIISGGDVCPPGLARKWSRYCDFYNEYGPTETTVTSIETLFNPGMVDEAPVGLPIGKPINNTTIYLLDRWLKPVPQGAAGELYIGGDGVARGYLNNPELTAEKFGEAPFGQITNAFGEKKLTAKTRQLTRIKEPGQGIQGDMIHRSYQSYRSYIYKTGDLARWLPDGNIEFIGRIDQQVKIRGFRVEPGEIEQQLLTHDKIKQAVVVKQEQAGVIPGETPGEEYLCAYIITDGELQISELRRYLSGRLPDYMIPSYFLSLEKLPLTPSGKLDRKALPEYEHTRDKAVKYYAPRSSRERKLAEIWAEVLFDKNKTRAGSPAHRQLKHPKISIDDNFFQLGGHSLKAALLVSKIHKEMNIMVPLTEVFNRRTIRELSSYIGEVGECKYIGIRPVEKREYYELSSAQKRLYFLQQMNLEKTTYNMPAVLPLAENIEIQKLENTIKKLIARHESLRTSFIQVNNVPVQKVHEPGEVDFKIDDYDMKEVEVKVEVEEKSDNEGTRGLAPLPVEIAERKAQNAERKEERRAPYAVHCAGTIKNFIRPFDLSKAPLIRWGIINRPGGHTIWLVDMHHIISDGTSSAILREDFSALYRGEVLPELRVRYKDFSRWQNRLFDSSGIHVQEDYWLELYKDSSEIPRLDLPGDYKRPKVFTYAGDHYNFLLEQEETLKFKALASRTGSTLYMNILAVMNVLFYKYTNQTDIIIGTVTAGRSHADLQHIIGMFVNTLAMRNYPWGEKPFENFLKEVIVNSINAFDNQDMQFEKLVTQLELNKDLSRNPLFDVCLVNLDSELSKREIEGLAIAAPGDTEIIKNKTAKFDLTLTLYETRQEIHFYLEYYTGLFKRETIQRLAMHFKNIIKQVSENPGVCLGVIDMLTDEEKHCLLYDFNDTDVPYPVDKNIHCLFKEQVQRTPDYIAIVGSSVSIGAMKRASRSGGTRGLAPLPGLISITYKKLNESANQLAQELIQKGIQPDTPAAIMVERSVEMITGILGILKAGGAYLPIDPDYPQERIDYMLKDSGAKILMTGPGLSEKIKKLLIVNCQLLIVNEALPNRRRLNNPPKEANLINNYQLTINNLQLERVNLAYIIYTSGTTGKPKGVMIQHQNLVRLLFNDRNLFDFNSDDVWTLFHSYCFDFSVWEMYGALLYGGKLVIIPAMVAKDPGQYWRVLVQEKVTVINQTPSAFYALIPGALTHTGGKINPRYVIFGGEALRPLQLKEWAIKYPHVKMINMFGITETTVHVTYKEIRDEEIRLNISNIGKPIPTLTTYILDRNLNLLPVGAAGELCVGGAGVGRGYLNRPELTADRFISFLYRSYKSYMTYLPKKIYKSGDLARWLSNGEMEYLGRIDHQVKIRGFRIELGEIETQLLTHSQVKEAVVITREEENGDKYLCAYVIPDLSGSPRSSTHLDIPGLRHYLSGKLPGYMIPAYFLELEKIPLTSNGKLDRNALPGPELTRDRTASYNAPRSSIEKKLAEIWTRVLFPKDTTLYRSPAHPRTGHPGISIDDNFFQLGGHSLKAAILVSKIHKEMNIKVPLTEVFNRQTIRELSGYIAEAGECKYIVIRPVEKKEYYELSSAQKRLYFLQQIDPDSTAYSITAALQLAGNIEIQKLENTIKKLIARHESLRTSFIQVNNLPAQKVHEPDEVEFKIDYYDMKEVKVDDYEGTRGLAPLPGTPAAHSPQPVKALISSFIRPFDLSRAPLVRSGIIKLPDGNHLWLVDMHHIISDGTSTVILEEDLALLYPGEILPRLRVQYKDFSQWQNRLLAGGEIKSQEDYWLGLYKDAAEIPRLDLPVDNKRPKVFNFAGDHYRFVLEKESTLKLKAMVSRSEGTLYMNILAALNALFYKYTNQTDIIIGTGIAGRPHEDLLHIIGMFVNTLAMRNYPQGDKTYEILLKEVISSSVNAFENQDLQFEELVDKLNLERDLSRNPLFDIMMVVQNFREKKEKYLLPSADEYRYTTSKFDMTFFVQEDGEDVNIIIEYYTGIFKRETIIRLVGHFQNLIKTVASNPGIKLAELDIPTEQEKEEVLYAFNDTAADYPGDRTICQLFAEQVEKTPDNISVVGTANELSLPGDLFITYNELGEKSRRLANYLYYEKHLQPDDRVGLLMDKSVERIAVILGVLEAGGAYVPLDPGLPEERIRTIINDAGIRVLVSGKRFIRTLNRLQWDCPALQTFLCMDSWDIANEDEEEKNELMDEGLWKYVAEKAVDDITAGGWISSYTGEPLSKAEMDEYGDNVLEKLTPLLHQKMRVLEIGCASGITMYRVAPRVGFYYGTDLSNAIIRENKKRAKQEGWKNLHLECLPAHEIDKIQEDNFDLVIINSVIQCFPGHNYLRKILGKAISLLGDRGYVFIGDIMDQRLRAALIKDLEAFKQANKGKNYTTKTDFSSELFVSRDFFDELPADMPGIRSVESSHKIGVIENELKRFRYDVLLNIDKSDIKTDHLYGRKKQKFQQDLRAIQNREAAELKNRIEPHHAAYVIYTSGTTGQPKGVVIQHRSLVNLCCWHNRYYGVTGNDRTTQLAGFGFDASVWEVFPYLVRGAVLYIIDDETRLDTARLNEYFESRGITIGFLPTQLCEQFMQEANHSLRALLTGGDKLNTFIPHSYTLYNNYGPTESTVVTTVCPVGSNTDMDNIPIGKPIDNIKVYILNPGYLLPQPVGAAGELCIGGDGLARGYLNDPELTAAKFKHDLWDLQDYHDGYHRYYRSYRSYRSYIIYRTGDLARWLKDGAVQFLGRIDQQVKIRGYRIEPGEIETRLLEHDDIKEVVVINKEKAPGDFYLCAYFVPAVPGGVDVDRLKDYLAEKLPDYMVPAYFIQVDGIPVTPGGKVDRKALPEPGPGTSTQYIAPGNPIEKQLVDIWAAVLGRDPGHASQLRSTISIDDNFFQLGGHSLKATVLTSKIHKQLAVKVPLAEVFASPTPRELARYIKNASVQEFSSIKKAAGKEYYALSSAQKRLFILQQLAPGSTAYNISSILILKGIVKKERFEETFKKLVKRHESLRTSFVTVNDDPVQRIGEAPFGQLLDAFGGSDNEGTGGLAPLPKGPVTALISSFIRSFDLSQAPLLRVGLIKNSGDNHILMVDMHHIISDGTSIALFIKEFTAIYAGEELPALRLHYKDYSEWQNRLMESGELKLRESFWKKQFEGDIPVINLPIDFVRPSPRGFAGRNVDFSIAPQQTKSLKQLASDREMTLYMVLLALFTVFLSKLSGQEDIVVGTPLAGRTHADLQHTIGMFVNTLALRNYPSADKTFNRFLAETKNSTLKAFENQDYPFETLVERLEVTRDLSRNPLFDVMLEMQNLEIPKIRIPGLILEPYPIEPRTSQFDLTLSTVEENDRLNFSFKYCTRLFKEETIGGFPGYFKNIVDSVTRDQKQEIAAIEIIEEKEKKKILYDFNNTMVEYPRDKTIDQLFEQQVEYTPDNIAIAGPAEREYRSHMTNMTYISYRELNERSNHLAHLLEEKGVKPAAVVGIKMERSVEMIVGIFAIVKAGGAYLPIDPGYPEERINYMLKDSAAEILLISDAINRVPTPHRLSCQSSNISAPSTSTCQVRPANLAYVIYTSGTTGRPKGAAIEHHSLVNRLCWMQKKYPLDEKDTILHKTPFTFDVSVWEIFWWSLVGAKVCLLPPGGEKDPKAITGTIVKNRVTVLHFVPSMLMLFLEYLQGTGKQTRLRSLRQVIASGEALTLSQVKAFKDILFNENSTRLANLYGPTEATIDVSYYDCCENNDIDVIPIGKPIDNIQLYILDKHLHIQPVGITGELYIAGVGLARGYLNRPELTAERFLPVFYRFYRSDMSYMSYILYRTGDLARWLPDGNIDFMGRVDHQVKIRGFRIELPEIEARLLDNKHIKETVVIAEKNENNDTSLCAYIVTDKELDVTELKEYLSQWLPGYMVPSYYKRLDRIPLTPNGKVNRKALSSSGTRLGADVQHVAPGTPTETRIAGIWREILQLKDIKVGIHDNFFDLGGTSMDVIRVNGRLIKEFNKEIPVVAQYKYTTVHALAHVLDHGDTPDQGLYPGDKRADRVEKGRSDKNKMRETRRRGRQ